VIARGARLAVALAAGVSIAACATSPSAREAQEPAEPAGYVVFDVVPPDAEVRVDGKPAGVASAFSVDAGPLRVEAGRRTIALSHPGHATWSREVYVGPMITEIRARLEPDG